MRRKNNNCGRGSIYATEMPILSGDMSIRNKLRESQSLHADFFSRLSRLARLPGLWIRKLDHLSHPIKTLMWWVFAIHWLAATVGLVAPQMHHRPQRAPEKPAYAYVAVAFAESPDCRLRTPET